MIENYNENLYSKFLKMDNLLLGIRNNSCCAGEEAYKAVGTQSISMVCKWQDSETSLEWHYDYGLSKS